MAAPSKSAVAQQLLLPDVRNVLSQYRPALDEVYTFYARLRSPAGGLPTLELDGLLHLLGDFELLPSLLSREDARVAFKQSENENDPALRDSLNRAEFDGCLLRLANAYALQQPALAGAAARSN